MDDQKQPNNQPMNQPKEMQGDASSSAPVEMEPATQNGMPTQQTPPVAPTAPSTPPVMPPESPLMTPEQTQSPVTPPMASMSEAPKKKNGMMITLIAVVLVVALALVGLVVYQAMK